MQDLDCKTNRNTDDDDGKYLYRRADRYAQMQAIDVLWKNESCERIRMRVWREPLSHPSIIIIIM